MEKNDSHMECDNSDVEDEDNENDQIEFTLLPPHIQCSVVEKFEDYSEFSKFASTSRMGNFISTSQEYSIPIHPLDVKVSENGIDVYMTVIGRKRNPPPGLPWNAVCRFPIHAQCLTIEAGISITNMEEICRLFDEKKTMASELCIQGPIVKQLQNIERLIEITHPKCFKCQEFVPRKLFRNLRVQEMTEFDLWRTGCRDRDLIKLKAEEISFASDFITSKGLNRVLKQWIRGKRRILRIAIDFGPNIPLIEDILDGIDGIRIWTKELHDITFLEHIPLEDLGLLVPTDSERIFAVWKPTNRKEVIFLSMSYGIVEIYEEPQDSDFLHEWSTSDEYQCIISGNLTSLPDFCKVYPRKTEKKSMKRIKKKVMS